MSNKKNYSPSPPRKKSRKRSFNAFVMTNLEILFRIFQSAVGGRDGGWGLSNEVPGGGSHRHTPGDPQRLNETETRRRVVYVINNNLK